MSQQDTRRTDLFFPPQPSTNFENNSSKNEAAFFFGLDNEDKQNSPTNLMNITTNNSTPTNNNSSQNNQTWFNKLAENPSLLTMPFQNQLPTQPFMQPSQSKSRVIRKDVSLYYVTEIAQFSPDEVNNGHVPRVDQTSGDSYGPIQDTPAGTIFHSREELSKVHANLFGNCSFPMNGGPAFSVLLLDTSNHDDRGNCALFIGEKILTNLNEQPALAGQNKALVESAKQKSAIRVIRGHEEPQTQLSRHVPYQGYRYDGLYFVGDYWYEQIDSTSWQYVFKLVRLYGQSSLVATTELYKSLFPPTSTIIQNETQQYGMNPNVQTFFPAPVTSPTLPPILPSSNAASAIHALLQRHKEQQIIHQQHMRQQQQQQFQQPSFPSFQQQQPFQQSSPQPQQSFQEQHNNTPINNITPPPPPTTNTPTSFQPFQQYSVQVNPSISMPSNRRHQFIMQPKTSILGMDLSHGPVKEMLTQLRRKNAATSARLESIERDIECVDRKTSTHQHGVQDRKQKGPIQEKESVTSRNKGFFWNLEKKRKREQEPSIPNKK